MKTIILILELASLIPQASTVPGKGTAKTSAVGTATLAIAACVPGDTVEIEPGNFRAWVDKEGNAVVRVPAQGQDEEPYVLVERGGSHSLHGTAAAGHLLSGTCQ